MKLALSAGALALSMALAGCGGGGSSTVNAPRGNTETPPTTPTTPDTPAEPTPSTVDLPTDGDSYLDSMVTLADTTAPISLATDGTHTAGHFTFTCTAGPCEITIEDGEVSATGTVSVAYSAAAQETIGDGEKAAMAEVTGRARGLYDALVDETGSRGNAIHNDSDLPGVTVSRGLSGSATFSRGGTSGWTQEAPSLAISGWEGKKLTREMDYYTVYTNIGTATQKAYLDHYKPKETVGGTAFARSTYTRGTPLFINPNDSGAQGAYFEGSQWSDRIAGIYYYNIAALQTVVNTAQATLDAVAPGTDSSTETTALREAQENLADAMAAEGRIRLATGAHSNLGTAGWPKEPDSGEAAAEYEFTHHGIVSHATKRRGKFKGTFQGAPGEYTCNTASNGDCTATRSARTSSTKSELILTGTWEFTPDQLNNPKVVLQDDDFIRFGYWMKKPVKADVSNEFPYDVVVFNDGSNYESADFDALTGKFTYTGPAAGLYATKESEADAGDAAHGEFTATATLAADFKDGSDAGTISGSIHNFSVNADWTLTLQETNLLEAGGNARIGAGTANDGQWSYKLHGADEDAHPTGVSGTFHSKIGENTAVAGAFGAATRTTAGSN